MSAFQILNIFKYVTFFKVRQVPLSLQMDTRYSVIPLSWSIFTPLTSLGRIIFKIHKLALIKVSLDLTISSTQIHQLFAPFKDRLFQKLHNKLFPLSHLSLTPPANQIWLLCPPLHQNFCCHCQRRPPSFHSQSSPFLPLVIVSSVGNDQNSVPFHAILLPGLPSHDISHRHLHVYFGPLFRVSLLLFHEILGVPVQRVLLSLAILHSGLICPMVLNLVTPKCEPSAQIAPLRSWLPYAIVYQHFNLDFSQASQTLHHQNEPSSLLSLKPVTSCLSDSSLLIYPFA